MKNMKSTIKKAIVEFKEGVKDFIPIIKGLFKNLPFDLKFTFVLATILTISWNSI